MARLPVPGADQGNWGSILNDYLSQALKPDGTVRDNAITANNIAPNSITNAAIASDAVNASSIVDGSITEVLLSTAVQTKLNAAGGTSDWNDITGKPPVIAAGATQSAARASIGAGTSDLVLGTTSSTAKPGDYTPDWNAISGKPAVIASGATQAAARTSIGAGTSDLMLGTTGTTAKAGDYTPAWTEVSGKPTVIAAGATQADARNAIGAGTSNLALGTTSTTAKPGDYTPVWADVSGKPAVIAAGATAADARAAIGAGSSNLVIGTTSTTAKAGDYTPTKSEIGIANVDNTSDLAKPISTATQTALTAKADLVNGLVPTSQLPSLALTNVVTVASQSAMLALTSTQVQPGDIAIRTDGAGTFILTDADPSVLANWSLLSSPTDAVSSVNGHTGTVLLTKADVNLGNVDNTSDASKNTAIATLTHKTIDGADNTLQNIPQSAISGLTTSLNTKISRSVVTVTGVETVGSVTGTDYVVFIGTGGEPTLPDAIGNQNKYTLKNIASDNRHVATTTSQTIEGNTIITLIPNASIDVLSDGTNWRII